MTSIDSIAPPSHKYSKHHHCTLQLRPAYTGLSPEMKAVIPVVSKIYQKHVKHNPHITAEQEWYGHCAWSLHHTGYAIDFRTINLPGGGIGETATKIAGEIRKVLGKDYYVLLHHDKPYHLHIQYRKGVRATLAPAKYQPFNNLITA